MRVSGFSGVSSATDLPSGISGPEWALLPPRGNMPLSGRLYPPALLTCPAPTRPQEMVKVEHEEIDVEESATWTVMIVGGRADGVGVPKGSV